MNNKNPVLFQIFIITIFCLLLPFHSFSQTHHVYINGLMHKYVKYQGNKKWSSKSLKSCNADSYCNISTDGLCVDKAKRYFGSIFSWED